MGFHRGKEASEPPEGLIEDCLSPLPVGQRGADVGRKEAAAKCAEIPLLSSWKQAAPRLRATSSSSV